MRCFPNMRSWSLWISGRRICQWLAQSFEGTEESIQMRRRQCWTKSSRKIIPRWRSWLEVEQFWPRLVRKFPLKRLSWLPRRSEDPRRWSSPPEAKDMEMEEMEEEEETEVTVAVEPEDARRCLSATYPEGYPPCQAHSRTKTSAKFSEEGQKSSSKGQSIIADGHDLVLLVVLQCDHIFKVVQTEWKLVHKSSVVSIPQYACWPSHRLFEWPLGAWRRPSRVEKLGASAGNLEHWSKPEARGAKGLNNSTVIGGIYMNILLPEKTVEIHLGSGGRILPNSRLEGSERRGYICWEWAKKRIGNLTQSDE